MLGSKLMLQPPKCHRLDTYRAGFRGKVAIPLHSSTFLRLKLTFCEVPKWFFRANKKIENADNFSQGFDFESAQIELKGDEGEILYLTN